MAVFSVLLSLGCAGSPSPLLYFKTWNRDEDKISWWSDTLKRLVCSQVLIPVRPHSVFTPPGWTHFYYRIRSRRVRLLISLLMSQMFKKKGRWQKEKLKLREPSEMAASPTPVNVIVNQPPLRLTLRWMAGISRPHPPNIHLMVCYLNPVIGSDATLLHTRLGSWETFTTFILNWHKNLYGVQHKMDECSFIVCKLGKMVYFCYTRQKKTKKKHFILELCYYAAYKWKGYIIFYSLSFHYPYWLFSCPHLYISANFLAIMGQWQIKDTEEENMLIRSVIWGELMVKVHF